MSGTRRGRMLPAPGLQVAICGTCQAKLDGPEPPPLCAFNGVHPLEFRPLVPSVGVLVEARLLPAVEIPPQRRFLWTAGADAQGPPGRSPGNRVERGGLGADRQEFWEISPSGMRFKAPHIYRADLFPPRPGILQSGPSRAADQVISPVVQTWRPFPGKRPVLLPTPPEGASTCTGRCRRPGRR